MKSKLIIFTLIGCFLLSLSGVSCTQNAQYRFLDQRYSSVSEALSAQKRYYDTLIEQITPVETPVGGSAVVIIPDDDFLRSSWKTGDFKPTDEQVYYMTQLTKNAILIYADALRKRSLFDEVYVQQSTNPEKAPFIEDFAIIRSATMNEEWSLRTRGAMQQGAIPIQHGVFSLSSNQLAINWLNSIEKIAKNLK